MSRRRRKGNPLLTRILLISVIVHVIAIPVLAKFGAFEKIRKQFHTNEVTVVPPPPPEKEKPIEKKAEKKQVAKAAKGKTDASKASHQANSNLPQPNVVAAKGGEGTGDSGPTVQPGGSGKVGEVPKPPSTGGSGTGTDTKPTEKALPTEVKPPVKPEPKPVEPKPVAPVVAVKPHVPVFAGAEPTNQVQPEVPDDLRNEALDKTTVVDILVAPDGSASEVKIATSSGVDELDQIAIRSAKKWRFKAATRDGEPVASHVRLHVQFKVD